MDGEPCNEEHRCATYARLGVVNLKVITDVYAFKTFHKTAAKDALAL